MTISNRTWTQNELIKASARFLKESNIKDSLRNVEWMLCELLKCTRAQLYAYPKKEIPENVLHLFEHMLERRAKYEPLQYILGYTEFYGLRIDVAPGVLIPRPETELLVEKALACLAPTENPTLLDIGTGSGCIALALKSQRPDATVYACDISEEALGIAEKNGHTLDLDINFFTGDIRKGLAQHNLPPLDLIISNPPYIPELEKPSIDHEVKDFEPEIALFVKEDPLEYYRSVTQAAQTALKEHGFLCFETHTDYTAHVGEYVENQGFGNLQVLTDLAQKPRIVIAQKLIK